jgi:hypothetical protein
LKAEFKFLCSTHQACPEVKEKLRIIGFTDFKNLDNSPSFDIFAKFELENEQEGEKVAKKVFEQCQEKVQTIQITT